VSDLASVGARDPLSVLLGLDEDELVLVRDDHGSRIKRLGPLEAFVFSVRAYFGHHKCASTWVWQLVAGVCREIGLRHYLVVYDRTPGPHPPLKGFAAGGRGKERRKGNFERRRLRERVDEAGAEFVSCITADREQLEALAPRRGFHVIRDPRDIIVSGYFSHRNSRPADHPEPQAWALPHIAEHRERLRAVPKEEGLLLEMDFARATLLDLAQWDYDRPEILELRMEELAARPYEGFVRIFQHLELLPGEEPTAGRELLALSLRRTLNRLSARPPLRALRRPMPATGEILLGAVYGNRFEAKTKGRPAGAEDTRSHYRKGVPGDWLNHFTPTHTEAFKERFGDLAVKLGYERDNDWGADELSLAPAET
jgi:hypothetical protein